MTSNATLSGCDPVTISVVVPVYNSEGSLPELVERLRLVLETLTPSFEVVLVNDGSRDRSLQVIEELAAKYRFVYGLDLMRNYGQHNALLAGIREARYDVIVTLDDDLQHPPEEIPILLDKLCEGYDVVYGAPEYEQHGMLRDLASQATKYALQAGMGAETARKAGAYRMFRTRLREAFESYSSPLLSIDVLLTWGTTRFSYVTVKHEPRTIGVSNYTFPKLVRHSLNMLTGFTTFPLQLASLVGFAFALFGVIVLVFVLGRYLLQGSAVPGFAFLASVIAIFSGAQLFALGIFGEYMARMHFRTMGKPVYTVREYITSSDAIVSQQKEVSIDSVLAAAVESENQ